MTPPSPADLPLEHLELVTIASRVGLAVVLGAIVGFERGISDKPADARTMALISAGAAGFMIIGHQIIAGLPAESQFGADPTRIPSYLIPGIGFLGGGAIVHSKKAVSGLTTAAAIWTSAALGAACGLGFYGTAVTLFVVMFALLWIPTIKNLPANGDEAS